MSRVQVLEIDNRPVAYVVPADIWERVRERVEEAEDAAAYAEAVREDDGFRVPADVVFSVADGANPVKVWREHRGLTLQALADAAGVSKPYVSQIENGKRAGTAATLNKLATAMNVPIDLLMGTALHRLARAANISDQDLDSINNLRSRVRSQPLSLE